jgi:hypothetical protein
MKVLLVSEGKHELSGALETLVLRLSPQLSHDKVSNNKFPLLEDRCPKGFAPFAQRVRAL